jgi:hypothetical protein
MISAIVLVNTALDAQGQILDSLKLVDGVEEAHQLYGVYEFLIKSKQIQSTD